MVVKSFKYSRNYKKGITSYDLSTGMILKVSELNQKNERVSIFITRGEV